MTLEEFKNHPDMQQSIQLYRDALLEAGTDFETVRSGIDNILGNAAEKDFSTELAVENLMGDLHDCANNQELQEPKGHFYGVNAISHNMIMYDRKYSRLANGLIFGQSGSGKGFFTKEIISNLLDGTDKPVQSQKDNRKEK